MVGWLRVLISFFGNGAVAQPVSNEILANFCSIPSDIYTLAGDHLITKLDHLLSLLFFDWLIKEYEVNTFANQSAAASQRDPFLTV